MRPLALRKILFEDSMKEMKKHPSLTVEISSSVKLSPKEKRRLETYLKFVPEVFSALLKKKIISSQKEQGFIVSLLLCGNSKIKTLNREHRQKDKVTDVLSFPGQEDLRNNIPSEKLVHLGDLAISIPVTRKQALRFRISFEEEFIHLFFHGLLHLLGFDHEISEKEERLMEEWEAEALRIFAKKKGP
jgi:probable rRNA maturation factor